jgi:hypothetical protein
MPVRVSDPICWAIVSLGQLAESVARDLIALGDDGPSLLVSHKASIQRGRMRDTILDQQRLSARRIGDRIPSAAPEIVP